MTERRVKVGNFSETPRKVFTYNESDPSNYVKAATPTRRDSAQPLKSNLLWKSSSSAIDDDVDVDYEVEGLSSANYSRPKTSRGTSHPSPDDFFDYVIPSPLSKHSNDFDLQPSSFMSLETGNTTKGTKNKDKDKTSKAGKSSITTKKSKKIKKPRPVPVEEEEDQYEAGGRASEAVQRQDETIFIGCWLFGSLLRV